MEHSTELSVLVYSCHKNSDMWPIFLHLYDRFWNESIYKLILLTDREESEEKIKGFDNVVVFDGTWYEMLNEGFNVANTPYVMLFMDDYLLCDYVKNDDIEKYISVVKQYNVANLRFCESEMIKPKIFKRNNEFSFYRPGSAYSLVTQPGIWDVSFLKKYMRPEWSAWDFERIGSLEVKDTTQPLLGTKEYVFPYIEGVRKGKWMREGENLCKRAGIKLDYDRRPKMSDFEMAWIYFKGGLFGMNPLFIQKMQNLFKK